MEKTRMLPVRLTDNEFMLRSSELAEKLKERGEIEREKKRVADRFKDRISGVEEEIGKLARVVQDKEEDRPVEVREQLSHDRDMVDIFRVDNGEVIDTRPLTDLERKNRRSFGIADSVNA